MSDAVKSFPFRDANAPLADRMEDLVHRFTLAEKIDQLGHENRAVERLGIVAYNWWSEACHGVGRNGRATVFPQVIAQAATWNRELVQRIAAAVADEARAKHHAAARAGAHGQQYQGLTFWAPNINIFRDPRWGRGQETFGEDPYLTGELGLANVRGLQGDDPRYLKVAACAKHFAVHSGPEHTRHEFDARPTPKDLYETYLPAFEKLVRGGVEAVMGAYNRVFGEPACASPFLLGEILRGRWGFKGHVVSDCGAIDDFHLHHHVTQDSAESAALAVRHGCDLNCGCTFQDLAFAVRCGQITEAEIDVALRRLLATKFKLGLFDPPAAVPYTQVPMAVVDADEHRALARRAAAESFVLLKNSGGVLPLPRDVRSMLVVGPTAANVGVMLGNYYGMSPRIVTFAEGIVARAPEGCRVMYRPGCPLAQEGAPGINYTFGDAAMADVVVAVLGLDPTLEGEEGDAVASPVGGDRVRIELPENQREFLRELRRHAKKLILVLTGGSALAAPDEHEWADAVLYAWYAGCEGGTALADVLFGDVAPSGRLPFTVPRRTEDLPAFDDYAMQGRTYKFCEIEPLYPFGFGLGYAPVNYESLRLRAVQLKEGEALSFTVSVRNSGATAAWETVECYLIPPRGRVDAARAELVEFRKVNLAPGAVVAVDFSVPAGALYQINADGQREWRAGRYQLHVGAASPGRRSLALGAPAPVTAEVEFA
ncbi:glycoside hydrolase family 3 C-terminal domain-containing protein [Horticoccus luteus]|uniref:Glycoside hydrolase family 3 C-terminal domain-containing protein n=1 Tax=Horticoccus luteus TaxID=2862869 RepID=A0A8F9TRG1_9BACT|nr:glycoside hydrolase family 3 C-terminal domain-containing protein [Horticoccus luteus]QYM77626.1 glycoside hydrolase family 3 C-terminal domain-containing protein [Horticoccus luteus]